MEKLARDAYEYDMLAWDRAPREEKVLTREEQRIMYTPVKLLSGGDYVNEDGENYGLSRDIVKDEDHGLIVSHSGGMPSLETWFEQFLSMRTGRLSFFTAVHSRTSEPLCAYGTACGRLPGVKRQNPSYPLRTLKSRTQTIGIKKEFE